VKTEFYVQFQRKGNALVATALTQGRPKVVRRGTGSVMVRFAVEIPGWVFDPLDLVATYQVPAEHTEPLIRLDSLGPDPEKIDVAAES
jgi:hypothetical protein